MKNNKYTNNRSYQIGKIHKKQVLRFVVQYIHENGYAPTLREIGQEVGLSIAAVHKYLNRLFDEGQLETDYHSKAVRNIRLPEKAV